LAGGDLATEQLTDKEIGTLVALRLNSETPPHSDDVQTESEVTKKLLLQWDDFVVKDGLVYRKKVKEKWVDATARKSKGEKTPSQTIEIQQLLLPRSEVSKAIELCHAGSVGGHFGIQKTTTQVECRFFWPGWQADVRRYCKSCDECVRYHRGKLPKHGPLKPVLAGAPYERWYIDLTGPHPKSDRGNIWILTCMDAFTKWAEAFPLRSKEAGPIAKILVEQLFSRFGPLLSVLRDLEREVDGRIMRQICQLFGVEKLRTTAYKPSTNQVDRFHRTMNSILAKTVSDHQKDWDTRLPFAMAAYRATQHDATGYLPNFLVLGRETRAPPDLVYGAPDEEPTETYDRYVEDMRDRAVQSFHEVRVSLQKSANRNKKYYDLGLKQEKFEAGQWVLYFNPRKLRGKQMKWVRQFEGPFFIVSKPTSLTAKIQKSPKSQVRVVHIDKLKHFTGTPPKLWRAVEVATRGARDAGRGESRHSSPERVELNSDPNVEDGLNQSLAVQGSHPEVVSTDGQTEAASVKIGTDKPIEGRVSGVSNDLNTLNRPMGQAESGHVDSVDLFPSMDVNESSRDLSYPMGEARSKGNVGLLTDSLEDSEFPSSFGTSQSRVVGGRMFTDSLEGRECPSSFRSDSSRSPVSLAPVGTPTGCKPTQNMKVHGAGVAVGKRKVADVKNSLAAYELASTTGVVSPSVVAENQIDEGRASGSHDAIDCSRTRRTKGSSVGEYVNDCLASKLLSHQGSAALPSASAKFGDRVAVGSDRLATVSECGEPTCTDEICICRATGRTRRKIGNGAAPPNDSAGSLSNFPLVPHCGGRMINDHRRRYTDDDSSQTDNNSGDRTRMDEYGYIYDTSDNEDLSFLHDKNTNSAISVEPDVASQMPVGCVESETSECKIGNKACTPTVEYADGDGFTSCRPRRKIRRPGKYKDFDSQFASTRYVRRIRRETPIKR